MVILVVFVRNVRPIVKNRIEFSCALERDLRDRSVYNLSSKNKEQWLGSLIEVSG